jgi:hypothetical protein
MRKLDWFLALLIGCFLAATLLAPTLVWTPGGSDVTANGTDVSAKEPATRWVSRAAGSIISAAWPTILRRR